MDDVPLFWLFGPNGASFFFGDFGFSLRLKNQFCFLFGTYRIKRRNSSNFSFKTMSNNEMEESVDLMKGSERRSLINSVNFDDKNMKLKSLYRIYFRHNNVVLKPPMKTPSTQT